MGLTLEQEKTTLWTGYAVGTPGVGFEPIYTGHRAKIDRAIWLGLQLAPYHVDSIAKFIREVSRNSEHQVARLVRWDGPVKLEVYVKYLGNGRYTVFL